MQQADGRELLTRGSQDVSAAAAQRTQLEALSRELVAEQQHLVKVASECQVGLPHHAACGSMCMEIGAVWEGAYLGGSIL